MPDYLTEAGWKSVLDKPKNLGLKAQKLGITKKLHDYETANDLFVRKPDRSLAKIALRAVQALKSHVEAHTTKHPAFTDATKYMKQIVAAAKTREKELSDRVEEFEEALEKEHDRKDVVRDFVHELADLVEQNKTAATLEEVAQVLSAAETLLTNAKKTDSKASEPLREVRKAAMIVQGLIRTRDDQLPEMLETFTKTSLVTARKKAGEVLSRAREILINAI